MGRAEDDGTFASDLHFPDSVKLNLIHDNLVVDALEQVDVRLTHDPEGVRLVVCHYHVERFAGIVSDLLINLVLIDIELESVLVVG